MKRKIVAGILVVFALIVTLASCTTAVKNEDLAGSGGESAEAEQEKIDAALKGALEEMKETGKDSINVFLGEEPGIVQEGDYVVVSFTARLEDGTWVDIEKGEAISGDGDGVSEKQVTVLAGSQDSFLEFGNETIGLKQEETTSWILSGESAFGDYDESKVKTVPRIREVPMMVSVEPRNYFNEYNAFPVPDHIIQFNPYLEAKIAKLEESKVVLFIIAEDGKEIEEEFGKVGISVDEESSKAIIKLIPEIGAYFNGGKVVSIDEDNFTVDYNHPLAGQKVEMAVTVQEIIKPSSFANTEIEWLEDYDVALENAMADQKPVFLLLYADWCQYCEKMMDGTLKDPWLRYFADKYVWVKINSDKEKSFKEYFEQRSFPTMVLMNPDGEISEKMTGYKKIDSLVEELLGDQNFKRGING